MTEAKKAFFYRKGEEYSRLPLIFQLHCLHKRCTSKSFRPLRALQNGIMFQDMNGIFRLGRKYTTLPVGGPSLAKILSRMILVVDNVLERMEVGSRG